MDFEIVGQITDIETIAVNTAIRELSSLQQRFGSGRWRKLIRDSDGQIVGWNNPAG